MSMQNMQKLKPGEVSKYYKQVPPQAVQQLKSLRAIVKEVLKGAQERISYQIPHFVYNGKRVAAIGGFKDHVSLFPLSTDQVRQYSKELKTYATSPGTIQFPLKGKLPKALIKKIITARLQQLFG